MKTLTLAMDLRTLNHEIRTPLTGILGMARLLEDENLPPDQLEKIQDIITSATYLQRFFEQDLLEKAKEVEENASSENSVLKTTSYLRYSII